MSARVYYLICMENIFLKHLNKRSNSSFIIYTQVNTIVKEKSLEKFQAIYFLYTLLLYACFLVRSSCMQYSNNIDSSRIWFNLSLLLLYHNNYSCVVLFPVGPVVIAQTPSNDIGRFS